MFIHSSKLILRNRLTQLSRRVSSLPENRIANEEIKPREPFIKHTTTTVLTKYNEIVGFKEIDQAYEKISGLQVSLTALIRTTLEL